MVEYIYVLHKSIIIKKEVMEVKNVLEGNYNHYEDFIELLSKLNPPLDKRFIEIMDEQLDAIPYEFSEMFIDGFKLGAKIMAEVFRCG